MLKSATVQLDGSEMTGLFTWLLMKPSRIVRWGLKALFQELQLYSDIRDVNAEGAGGAACPHPYLGRSVNPIQTKVLSAPSPRTHPRIFRPAAG